MDRKVVVAVVSGATAGMVLGYALPAAGFVSYWDAPSGSFTKWGNGDGWHTFSGGGFYGSDQLYSKTQSCCLDGGDWHTAKYQYVGEIDFWDTASGIMAGYAGYSVYGQSHGCVDQRDYSNAWVKIFGSNTYVNDTVGIWDDGCNIYWSGESVGADAIRVFY
jgi:hypothetical protein